MRILLIIAICSILFTACKNSAEDRTEKAKNEIIQTEKTFSLMSQKKGMRKAFLSFASEDVIKLRRDAHPVIGINALREAFDEDPGDSTSVLSWYPVRADAAASGEIGYTFGNWTFTGIDSLGKPLKVYGNYVTIWKKDKNGSWKFTLDGGNTTPPTSENQERL